MHVSGFETPWWSGAWRWTVLICIAGMTLCAQADQSDYARGRVLDTSDQSLVQRLTIPDDVYEWTVRADLGDLRLFNSSQEEMPFSLRRPQHAEEFSPWVALPLFPLPSAENGSAGQPRVRVEVNDLGTIIAYSAGVEPGETAEAFLLDASGLDSVPTEMQLHWPHGGAEDFVSRVRVETSDDLNTWRTLIAGTTLASLSGSAEEIRHSVALNRIELPRRQARYLRITQIEGTAPLAISGVRVRHRRLELPQRRWRTLDGSALKGGWEFTSGGWYPVDRLRVGESGSANYLASAHLYSRSDENAAWRERGLRTFYRSSIGGQVVESEPLVIDEGDRFWRVEFEGEGIQVPVLTIGWLPDEVVFLKQGAAPYVLAYGQAGVTARQWPLTELLRQLNGHKPVALADVPFASVAEPQMLGGPDRLLAVPDPIDWRTVVLWSVLVLGVLLVGGMAYRLLRS